MSNEEVTEAEQAVLEAKMDHKAAVENKAVAELNVDVETSEAAGLALDIKKELDELQISLEGRTYTAVGIDYPSGEKTGITFESMDGTLMITGEYRFSEDDTAAEEFKKSLDHQLFPLKDWFEGSLRSGKEFIKAMNSNPTIERFIESRLDEEEQDANSTLESMQEDNMRLSDVNKVDIDNMWIENHMSYFDPHCGEVTEGLLMSPARALEEISTKRAILGMAEGFIRDEMCVDSEYRTSGDFLTEDKTEGYYMLRLMASMYSGHPHYNSDWKIEE